MKESSRKEKYLKKKQDRDCGRGAQMNDGKNVITIAKGNAGT